MRWQANALMRAPLPHALTAAHEAAAFSNACSATAEAAAAAAEATSPVAAAALFKKRVAAKPPAKGN